MHSPRAANYLQCPIARRLRPAVAIEVGQQTVVGCAVQSYSPAERSLLQDALHRRPGPVLRPGVEESFLTLAQQLQSAHIDALGIVGRVIDVVRTRTHLRNLASGP